MKKNILTIIIMAIVLINTVLTGVLIFVIVPTSNKTNQLVTKVASIVDLELEDPSGANGTLTVSDIVTYDIEGELMVDLRDSGDASGTAKAESTHYARIPVVSLSVNSKHKDYEDLFPQIAENESRIREIVTDEIGKHTRAEVKDNKNAIKDEVLIRIQELFNSDFIINISFDNMVLS
jgi:flagellar basal body-associated protein FliL